MVNHEAVIFDAPSETPDGYGGVEIGWSPQFSDRAHILYLRGGEAVQTARLQGRQPVVLTVRNHNETQLVTTDWRVRNERTGTVYNIRAIVPSDDRRFFEITCESGVAV